ncbi:MAG: hypothetical protein ACXWZT_13825 [Gaiellaceae bacterium]
MESLTETTSVVRELTIAARPETVWEFLVDPAKAERWMGVRAVLDPHLPRLVIAAGGGDPGRDPWLDGEM